MSCHVWSPPESKTKVPLCNQLKPDLNPFKEVNILLQTVIKLFGSLLCYVSLLNYHFV